MVMRSQQLVCLRSEPYIRSDFSGCKAVAEGQGSKNSINLLIIELLLATDDNNSPKRSRVTHKLIALISSLPLG
jgi:hypothetical protein